LLNEKIILEVFVIKPSPSSVNLKQQQCSRRLQGLHKTRSQFIQMALPLALRYMIFLLTTQISSIIKKRIYKYCEVFAQSKKCGGRETTVAR
jgi:hypothetical protein